MIRYFFTFIIFVHGFIHFMGFAKAFGYGNITQITKAISKPFGVLWLFAAMLLIIIPILFLLKIEFWWLIAIVSVLLSQVLIFTVWQDAKFGTIANAVILIIAAFAFIEYNYKARYKHDVAGILATSTINETDLLTENDIAHLPEAVRKYMHYTGCIGKPKVHNFKVEFKGRLRKNNESEWMPFTSGQYNFMERPTRLFFMNAVMKHLPIAGYHAYKNGEAFMDIRLFSIIKVQYQSGNEMNTAETVTFFNDMCCMAPATLIDRRIKWISDTNNIVMAQFTVNGISISATLFFNEKGELINFVSPDRYALQDDGNMKKMEWSTPLKDYKEINGHRIAGYAEAIYKYPSGNFIYGIFTTREVEYNCKK